MPKYTAVTAYRGVSAFSGILGLAVIVVSAILLDIALGYRYELGSIFGLGNLRASNYFNTNRYSYNVLGYEVDPLIGISGGGIVIGILQFLACFLLCCARRKLSLGWTILQFILLLGVIACFALAIYYEVYSRKILPGYGALGQRNANGFYNNYNQLGVGGLGFQQPININYPLGLGVDGQFGGIGGGNYYNQYDGRYGGDYLCNPAGQAYCAIFGIDMVFLIVAMVVIGCAGRREEDRLVGVHDGDSRTYRVEPVKTKV